MPCPSDILTNTFTHNTMTGITLFLISSDLYSTGNKLAKILSFGAKEYNAGL